MRPSSSPSDGLAGPLLGRLFGPLFGGGAADEQLDDRAWLQAMLDVEAGIASAGARAGLIPAEAASAIVPCCVVDRFDAADLGRRAVESGNPVVPLVRDLGALVPSSAAPYVHLGATSQDVLDTAACLVANRALAPILADLAAAAEACAALTETHRDTLHVARTLLQQALPTTFGLTCAGWLVALDEATAQLVGARGRLAVQFGGAAGTLAALGAEGVTVAGLLADELGLAEPTLPWHTNRVRVANLAAAIGVAAGVLGKIAQDVVLLAQTEVAEVREESGGSSSAMPHKHNPVGAVLVSACARRVPGLVATMLAAMAQEHQRGAGGWHAEWETQTALLRLLGGAAHGASNMLAGLQVDAARMRENLDRTGGLLLAEQVAGALAGALGRVAAHDLVARACREAEGRPLREVLLREPDVRKHLSEAEIDAALDPTSYLGSAGALVDRALASHREAVS